MSIVNYFKFICSQLNHLQRSNYILWAFAVGVQLMILIQSGLTWITALTFIGTSLGVLCVVAINAAKSINGWLGLLSGACFIAVDFSAKNYLAIGEQVAYICTLDLPVLLMPSWNFNMASHIRKFNWKSWSISIISTLLVYAISGFIIGHVTNDPRPWFDAISFAISLMGGIICTMKFNSQYIWWLASGIAQVVLWFITFKQGGANAGMLVNSLIYVANDVLAFTVSPWYNKKVRESDKAQDRKLDRA